MAIPSDDPRLAPVLIERDEVQVEPLERDSDGRLILSDDFDAATFVPLQPSRKQYDGQAARDVLDVGITGLTTEGGGTEETQTTTIS